MCSSDLRMEALGWDLLTGTVAAAGARIGDTFDFRRFVGDCGAVAHGDGQADFLGQGYMARGLIGRGFADNNRIALATSGDAAEGCGRG